MRAIGLDVHLDFCEVAIVEDGEVRSAGRIETKPEQIELFAGSLGPDDRVALEVTGNAWEIARIIEGHVARVLVVSPSDTGIRQARAKTDRLDARTLARLLAAGSLDAVWMPDRETWVMRRRLSRRGQRASGVPTTRSARPSASSPAKPRSPTHGPCATGTPPRRRRWARVRHRGAHPTGPRRAKPRGRPQAPDVCASLTSVTRAHTNDPTTPPSWQDASSAPRAPIPHAQSQADLTPKALKTRYNASFSSETRAQRRNRHDLRPKPTLKKSATSLDFHPSS
jgi:hypothetical protein